MKKLLFLFLLIAGLNDLAAQSEKDYIIEIDGDSVFASLGEPAKFMLKDGKSIVIKIRKKEFLSFQKGPVSFSYPSKYSVTSKAIDEDAEQILLMSAGGAGIMIQVYSSLSPTGIVDFMLAQIAEDDIKAGYKESKTDIEKQTNNGILLKGKRAVLKMDDDIKVYSVLSYGKGKKGIMIIEINSEDLEKDEQQLFDVFWSSLTVKY
ncbi:MAG TPA: hypothetical protein VK483_15085 [Chitinophagaceae bacterium]|nr:hypothetical protein [Chitinophagaceae bacterium]